MSYVPQPGEMIEISYEEMRNLRLRQSVINAPPKTICPCCKSAISVKIPIVDLNTNTVSWQGKSTKLTPKQAELTTLLLNKFPGAETHRKIEQGMWGMGEMVEANNLIKVFVTQLRHKLQPLNITVLNVRGYGYRLELAQ